MRWWSWAVLSRRSKSRISVYATVASHSSWPTRAKPRIRVFDAHHRAFAFWGGVPMAGIYDNPKTLVDAILVGKERQFNRRFLALMNHSPSRAHCLHAGSRLGEGRSARARWAPCGNGCLPHALQVRPLRGLERLGIASCAARSSGFARIQTRRSARLGRCSRRSAPILAPLHGLI
jgi:hypothetical protein